VGIVARLHNPARKRCGCPPECICQRSKLGRAFRWYIPRPFHTGIPPDEKAARLRAAGLDYGED
jgi:hypothetical protein